MTNEGAGVYQALAERVRRASRAGELVRLDETCPVGEDDFAAWMDRQGAGGMGDIVLIREGGKAFLFSDLHMTRSYAQAVALGSAGNPLRSIAVTVRSESATYPRPTPVDYFCRPPFSLTGKEVAAAIDQLLADPEYADIRATRASNGDLFLFSLNSLEQALAESMAEWLAVGRYENP